MLSRLAPLLGELELLGEQQLALDQALAEADQVTASRAAASAAARSLKPLPGIPLLGTKDHCAASPSHRRALTRIVHICIVK